MPKLPCHDDKSVFEKLDPYKHNRTGFDCGSEALNNFIIKFARQQQEKKLSVSYVATYPGLGPVKNIFGYYTISANAIRFEQIPNNFLRSIPQRYPIPTIKIGRLARDIWRTKPGFGSILLRDALYRCMFISDAVGALAIDVDAKNDVIANYYREHGFIALNDNPNSLIIAMKTVESTYSIYDKINHIQTHELA